MAKELEIEYKNLLTKNEYEKLLASVNLTEADSHEQTNIYFDTIDNALKMNRQGLRIRLLSDRIEFTLKVPQENNYTYLEITDSLSSFNPEKELKEQIEPQESDVLTYLAKEDISISELNKIGFLSTIRAEKKLDANTLLVLDKSTYYGITDYELEMEVTDGSTGLMTFTNFLEKNEIPVRPAKKKIARMFERKMLLND